MVNKLDKYLDPRPDLKEDASIWNALFTLSLLEDEKAYGVLRGMRIIGCKLSIGDEIQKMVFKFPPECTDEKKEIIKKHAGEHKEYINDVFTKVWRGFYNQAQGAKK